MPSPPKPQNPNRFHSKSQACSTPCSQSLFWVVHFFLFTTPKVSCFLRENQFLLMSRTPSGSLPLICPALFRPKHPPNWYPGEQGPVTGTITSSWFMRRDSRSNHILNKANQAVFLWKPPEPHTDLTLSVLSFPLSKSKAERLFRSWCWHVESSECCPTCPHSRIPLGGRMARRQRGSCQWRDLMLHSRCDFSVSVECTSGFLPYFLLVDSFPSLCFYCFRGFRGSVTKNVKFTFQVCPVLLVHSSLPLTFLLTASTTTSETLTTSMWHWFCNPPKPVIFFFFFFR